MRQPSNNSQLVKIIESLGTDRLSGVLLELLHQVSDVEHFSLSHIDERGRARFITSGSESGKEIPESLQQLYITHHFQADPNSLLLDQLKGDEHSVIIRRLLAEDIQDADYRHFWKHTMHIVDRLSLILKSDKGLYCFNLYRHTNPFSETDIEKLISMGDLLAAIAVKHARLAGSLSSFHTRDSQIQDLIGRLTAVNSNLTPRELQVCARILIGMTSEGIALDLDINSHSVVTYRKRAYAKLNISSQNELFLLCLTARMGS
jgi:DNA-binding CsgD family transcriptional regulator